MKPINAIVVLFITCSLLMSACVKDGDAYSDHVKEIIDSIAYYDTAAIFFDKPCTVEENTISYKGEEEVFLVLSHNGFYSEDEYWIRSSFSGFPTNELLLKFRIKPVPGWYATIGMDEELTADNQVYLYMIFEGKNCYSFQGDTIYVEQFSGGLNTYTWCDVLINNAAGLSNCSGNITPE